MSGTRAGIEAGAPDLPVGTRRCKSSKCRRFPHRYGERSPAPSEYEKVVQTMLKAVQAVLKAEVVAQLLGQYSGQKIETRLPEAEGAWPNSR